MNHLAKSAIIGTGLLLLSKILGFIREICLAYQFGTSYIVDAYTAAIALPDVLFAIYAFGFSESFIPVYMRIQGEEEKKNFFSNVLTILLLGALVIMPLCMAFSNQLAILLAPGFDAPARTLLQQFISIIAVIFPIMTANNLLSAQLQALEEFAFVQFCEHILINVVIIGGILIAAGERPYTLVIGYILAYLLAATLLFLRATRKKGLKYRPQMNFGNPYFATLCSLAIPMGASRVVSQLNGVVDRLFASLLGEGVTGALSYANKVQLLFYTLTTALFISVCFPRINKHFAQGDTDGGMYYIRKAILIALYVSIPVMGGLLFFAEPLVSLVFERGRFDADSTTMTAACLAFYGVGIPFYALREIGSRALAASIAQKKILKNTAISVVCNVCLNLLLLRPMGYRGLALATSLTGVITVLLVYIDLRKLNLRIFDREETGDCMKIVLMTILSLVLCGACYNGLQHFLGEQIAILAGVAVAGVTYLSMSILLRVKIVVWIYQRLPAKVRIISVLNDPVSDK